MVTLCLARCIVHLTSKKLPIFFGKESAATSIFFAHGKEITVLTIICNGVWFTSMTQGKEGYTTVSIRPETRRRLKELKPYPSVSYDDLLQDMVDSYAGEE